MKNKLPSSYNSINKPCRNDKEMAQPALVTVDKQMEEKAERNSARTFHPTNCVTHKYKNKHFLKDCRAHVVLGTSNSKSVAFSGGGAE